MITSYNYEGKNLEEIKEKAINELGENIYLLETEETTGLFKTKKAQLKCFKKEDIFEFIKNYISNIGSAFDTNIHSEIKETEGIISIILVSENNPILIGKEGRNLKAIETLLKQTLLCQTGINIKINLDISNYKGKKEKNLKYQVKTIAKEVLKTKMDIKLDPMNSYERRIVHTVIADFKELSTESEGEEPNRCVVIKYKED